MTRGLADLLMPLRMQSDRPALRSATQAWTYGALHRRAMLHAAAFEHCGCKAGDRIVVLAHPSLDLVAAMLGAYLAGLVWVPLNPRYRPPEVAHVLHDCRPALVLCDREATSCVPASPGCSVYAFEDVPGLSPWPVDERRPQAAARLTPATDRQPSLIIYTSGTTGRSKGVVHTHRSIATGIGALTDAWRFGPSDVLSAMLPLFHVHGLCIGIHGAWLHGMEVLLHASFDPAAVAHDVASRGATVFMGVPAMYNRLLAHLDAHPHDGPRLAKARLYTAGSAALAGRDLERFEQHTGHRILERYGMSETLLTISNPYAGERRAGSIGLPLEGVEIRVCDDHNQDVDAGVPGELWVRCEGMMLEYWGLPEVTASSFDSAGWFRTGDVVERDPDGYLRIVGRSSVDIIKSGGFKIGAREIEDVLLAHPDVREVAVFGVPDERWGERVVAAIVPEPGLSTRSPEAWLHELQQWASVSLTDYKKPREIHVIDAVPRNALGKPQKALLKGQLGLDMGLGLGTPAAKPAP